MAQLQAVLWVCYGEKSEHPDKPTSPVRQSHATLRANAGLRTQSAMVRGQSINHWASYNWCKCFIILRSHREALHLFLLVKVLRLKFLGQWPCFTYKRSQKYMSTTILHQQDEKWYFYEIKGQTFFYLKKIMHLHFVPRNNDMIMFLKWLKPINDMTTGTFLSNYLTTSHWI